ncbi:class I SAM-dependent methyltransferase [Actinomadura opuntiae]|uniref:class I SAM-dependent methyltransferase n=1 Tax=Actinomadura sp. OS1-43 TaxID=604315 RepID=UPI003341F82C
MAPTAAYIQIADWYEHEFLGGHSTGARTRDGNPLDLDGVLRHLLDEGSGICLEIGCGTGVHAVQVRELGWTPIGIDLSAGMLRHARSRLPVAQANAEHLPFPDDSLPRRHRDDGPYRHARLPRSAARSGPGPAAWWRVRARRRPSLFLRRIRRPQQPGCGSAPPRLPRRAPPPCPVQRFGERVADGRDAGDGPQS